MLTQTPTQTNWETRYAARMGRVTQSAIREILKLLADPSIISLAGGIPAPELFPVARLQGAYHEVLAHHAAQALQYSATEGITALREEIAKMMQAQGVPAEIDNVLITSGSQQGLDLVARVLVDPNSPVVISEPAYVGAIQALNSNEASYVSVPMDDRGMVTDHISEVFAIHHPRLVYSVPNFDNPSGTTMTLARRELLLEAAHMHGVPVIEDDPYRALRYEGRDVPGLLALDTRDRPLDASNVIYLGSFSKIVTPGLRIAWVVAPRPLLQKLVLVKQGADLHTNTINQMVILNLLQSGFLKDHIETLKETYQRRRDVMLNTLQAEFPAWTSWTHPEGGMFVWVTLPEKLDCVEILKVALEHKVAFVPGNAFYATKPGCRHFRLSFSNPSEANIAEGITRLGKVLRRFE